MIGRASWTRAKASFAAARAIARRQWKRDRAAEADGFAAVDALVALTIISTTLILSLGAAETARRASVSAAETRRANELLQYLIDAAPSRIGAASGRASGFDWRVEVRAAAGAHAPTLQVCDRSAQLISRQSGRRYALASARLCPVSAAS